MEVSDPPRFREARQSGLAHETGVPVAAARFDFTEDAKKLQAHLDLASRER